MHFGLRIRSGGKRTDLGSTHRANPAIAHFHQPHSEQIGTDLYLVGSPTAPRRRSRLKQNMQRRHPSLSGYWSLGGTGCIPSNGMILAAKFPDPPSLPVSSLLCRMLLPDLPRG